MASAHGIADNESELLLEALLTDAPVGIALVGRDLRFVRANGRFVHDTGGTPLEGVALAEALPGLASTVVPLFQSVLRTGEPVVLVEVKGAVREGMPVHSWTASLFPVRGTDGGAFGVGVVVRDLTELRAAEAKLHETERRVWEERERLLHAERESRLRAQQAEKVAEELLARVTDGFVAFDRDFRYTHVNAQAAAMFGRAPEDLIGRNYYEEFPEAVGTPFEQAYVRAIRDQEPVVFEDYFEPWDRWFENRIFPSADGLSIFFSEITDRKRLERDLRRQAERLAVLHRLDREILAARSARRISEIVLEHLESVAPSDWAAVVVTDDGGLTVLAQRGEVAVPDSATRQCGPCPEWLAGLGPEDPIGLDAVSGAAERPLAKALRDAGLPATLALPLLDETRRPVGLLCLASSDAAAFGAGHVAALREVAAQLSIALRQAELHERLERHAAELDARVAERTAELEERNAELEAFSYTVSHDLRAPLRALQGFSQALLEDNGEQLDELGREYATRIVKAAGRLDLLIQDLLAYSRLSRADLTLTRVDLEGAIGDALAQLETDLTERGAHVELRGPFPRVRAHRATLVQVVANLVSNAVKFVARGVVAEVTITAERRGAAVRCWVEDNGIGVAAEHRERIFRVFERLHGIEAYPGTGIGLAIFRKGLERMGGRAGMEPREAGGSRFWIELPGVEEE